MPTPISTEQINQIIKTHNVVDLDRTLREAKDDECSKIINMLKEYLLTCDVLNDELQLKFILETVQILESNNLSFDLSFYKPPSLFKIIQQLLCIKPSKAKWVLDNLHQPINDLFNLEFRDFAKTEIFILGATEESTALYYCLNKLNLNISSESDFYIDIVNDFIQIDSEEAITLALSSYTHKEQHKTIPLEELYTKIVTYDSTHCLKKFIAYIQQNESKEYAHVFDKEDSFLKKIRLRKLLSGAINAYAPKAIAILLDNMNFSLVLEEYIKNSAKEGNIIMVLALCRNDFVAAAHYLLSDSLFYTSKEAQEHLYNHLITMLRFSPIEVVDELVEAYSKEHNKAALLEIYKNAKHHFFQHASAFSRLNPNKYKDLTHRYHRSESQALIQKAQKDMEYGEARSELVTNLVNKMKESTSESPFKPTKTEFISLPSSKHGSKIFAALLERISNNTYQNNPEANQREYFSQLCHRRDMVTPTRGYDWARGLIPAVLQYSQSEEVLKYPRLEDINDQAGYPIKCLYSLTYNGKIINNVTFGYFSMAWGHGRLSLDETIGDIEDLLEKMMNAPFGAQASSNTTKKEVEEQGEVLDQFYADAAKLVWLIGNTTPMQRGSGSVAELTLKAIFEYHQLKTPILKPEFPQLDVLDITFPLDDYMKLFPYFCEPSSLPEHLRKPSFSSLSSSEQIVQFYNEINGVALIRIEARLSNVAIHNEEKITSSTTPNLSEVKQQNHPNHHLVPTTFTAQNPSEETTPFTARNPSKMS